MKHSTLDDCVNRLLDITQKMETVISETDFEPDQIIQLLQERASVIEEIKLRIENKEDFSIEVKQTKLPLLKVLDEKILEVLQQKKLETNEILINMKKAKNMQKGYQEFDYYEFGAYIDKKN